MTTTPPTSPPPRTTKDKIQKVAQEVEQEAKKIVEDIPREFRDVKSNKDWSIVGLIACVVLLIALMSYCVVHG